MEALEKLLHRAETLLERLEGVLPAAAPAEPDWQASTAFRWCRRGSGGYLEPVRRPHRLALDDLLGVDRQKNLLAQNTRQFVEGRPANNALMWGARGTGKSSLIKALLNEYADSGLRLIEVDRHELVDLPLLTDLLEGRPERFLLFCDDLSFEGDDPSYKALKVALDGSISAPPENVLIYATSNRRHLLPEYQEENQQTRYVGEEVHPGEAVEEKVSLSDRFGLWLSFYPFDQETYLAVVAHWLQSFGIEPGEEETVRRAALQWATARGSRSGRSAWQFARDWAGRHGV